jgi:hypothetical protein
MNLVLIFFGLCVYVIALVIAPIFWLVVICGVIKAFKKRKYEA